ncbi:hypothetical protein, partial [Streptomyces anthocyanicus]
EVRWLLSTVPSCMIFDDHDVIDDWNTSAAWLGTPPRAGTDAEHRPAPVTDSPASPRRRSTNHPAETHRAVAETRSASIR